MFILVTIIISLAILAAMYQYSQRQQAIMQRQYDVLVELRQILHLTHQHRRVTHLALLHAEDYTTEIEKFQQELSVHSNHLISTVHLDNKPMYRIFQTKLADVMQNWPTYSPSRNQVIHGKTLRHGMFLIDEVVLDWLLTSNKEFLCDEYHQQWQMVVDSLDALTQLHICIADLDSKAGQQRFILYADIVYKKVNQLSFISALPISTPDCLLALQALQRCSTEQDITLDADQLYHLMHSLSMAIANEYDLILSRLTKTLFIPLPKMVMA
ncbi:MAG: hypothetical protein ACTMIA_10680 [Vibrio sp.]